MVGDKWHSLNGGDKYGSVFYLKTGGPCFIYLIKFLNGFDSSFEGPKHVLDGTENVSFATIYKTLLQNQYIGGTKDVSAATIYRTCFGPSELKLWNF
ncbi:hypothetical protein BpHYR1_038185 [Brachionus plicatilis]|uniref:Uncharacterized protein n=1 Tax=Brachionus plicatilis TaxID=10195 RepID=A0A3M7RB12_BRAPC|nr:hypothetical protein BpHYR1_038185 [Brachionus plicatilis]